MCQTGRHACHILLGNPHIDHTPRMRLKQGLENVIPEVRGQQHHALVLVHQALKGTDELCPHGPVPRDEMASA